MRVKNKATPDLLQLMISWAASLRFRTVHFQIVMPKRHTVKRMSKAKVAVTKPSEKCEPARCSTWNHGLSEVELELKSSPLLPEELPPLRLGAIAGNSEDRSLASDLSLYLMVKQGHAAYRGEERRKEKKVDVGCDNRYFTDGWSAL